MSERAHRAERLAELLRQELGELVEYEVRDPRVGSATVTAVALSSDLRTAYVSLTVEGGELEKQQTLKGLAAAQGFLRRELAQRLGLRHTPAVWFQLEPEGPAERPAEQSEPDSRSKP